MTTPNQYPGINALPDTDPSVMQDIGYGSANAQTTARIREYLEGSLNNVVTPPTGEYDHDQDSLTAGFMERKLKDSTGRIIGKEFVRPDGASEVVIASEERYGSRQFGAITKLINKPPQAPGSN